MVTMRHSTPWAWGFGLVLGLGLFAGTAAADVDPPDRVARVSFLRGNVSFQPAGDDQWAEASLNRPLVTGDKIYADRDSRAELDVGAATLRLDERSTFSLLNLDDDNAQVELTEGTLNVSVRRLLSGQTYEVDTPTLAFVIDRPGNYRIDIAPQGDSTMVTVFDGSGAVYGENNASYSVRAGNSYKFHDSALRDYEVFDLPRRDDFDQWCSTRDARYTRAVSSRYVSEDVIGYADLDDYGSWSQEPTYGSVWYPTTVDVGWTPYRYGRWSWVDPWGWSWIDSSPWGFAPFHYGRWAYIGNRWGWCPGAYRARPIYAPALVAFVGGGGWGGVSIGIGTAPVGWFPLGPRDVYVPWYRASRNYFTNVNVRNTTIINNTYITNVYNDYSRGRPVTGVNYAYRNVNAVTAVPRDAFVGSRGVANARMQINEANLRNAQVVSRVGIAPQRASFAATAGRGTAPPAAAMTRPVIARSAPPAAAAPIASRIQAIERNGAQPLARQQLSAIAARPGVAGSQAARQGGERVQVVGRGAGAAAPKPLPMQGTRGAVAAPATGNARVPAAPNAAGATRGNGAPLSPATRGSNPQRSDDVRDRAGALPSARFAPPRAGSMSGNRGEAAPAVRPTAPNPSITAPRSGSTTPAERAQSPRTAPAGGRTALPSERFAPPRNTTSPAVPPRASEPRSTPHLQAPAQSTQRSAPVQQYQPRNTTAPQPRSTAPQRMESRTAPAQPYQPRSAPVQQYQRSAPTQPPRSTAPQRIEPRTAPAQSYQPRSMPAQPPRSAPAASQPRVAAPQHVEPRAAPSQPRAREPQRDNDRAKKDRDDRH